MIFRRPKLMLAACLLASLPALAQSYQSRFEQVKFDREGAGGSKAGVMTIDGATGAASVDMPLGPGIGEGALHFTPAVRVRSNGLSWTQTNVTDPNAYLGTPPFLIFNPSCIVNWVTILTVQQQTETIGYATGGTGDLSPGTLDLAIPDSRNRVISTVSYPDGDTSTLGAAVSPGSQGAPNGFISAGALPTGASDPSTTLTAFHHGQADGWSLAKLPFYLNTDNGVVTSNPAVPSDFVSVGANGELVVGLQSPSSPVVGIPEPDMPNHVVQLPSCILVVRGDIAYEFAFIGTLGATLYIPLPRVVNEGSGKTKQWLASGHYIITRMLDRFGNAIVFDHGLNLLGSVSSGVAANGLNYTARWVHKGAPDPNPSIQVTFQGTISTSGNPITGTSQVSTVGNRLDISYSGGDLNPDYQVDFYYSDGSDSTVQMPGVWDQYQIQPMDTGWDQPSHHLLPLAVKDVSTGGAVTFSYGAPAGTASTVLTQIQYPNGRRQTLTWGSYPYRPNQNEMTWGGYAGDPNRQNAQAWGVTQVVDADTVLGTQRLTTHSRVVPQPDPSNLTGWLSTTFYDAVTRPDGAVTVYFYVEPQPGGSATLQTLCNLQQQVREIREYRDGSTWQSDVSVPASSSTADRITVLDHWDLRSVADPSGSLGNVGVHPYPTRTRTWDRETGILTLQEKTGWDAQNFSWNQTTHQSYFSAGAPSLAVDYPSLALGGSSTSYASLARQEDEQSSATFDAGHWIGPLATQGQEKVSADVLGDLASGQTPPFIHPPVATDYLTGTSLPKTVTVGNTGLQVQTAFTYPGGAQPSSPTPSDATLVDPDSHMLNSGLVGAIYSYDSLGHLSAIQPMGVAWQAHQTQDGFGRVLSQTGADGVVTAYDWDASGRLKSVQVGSELATVYSYDDTTHRIVTVTRGAQQSELHYDAFGELILEKRIAQGVPSYKIYGRDSLGRVNGETLWLPSTVNGHTVTDQDAFQPNLLTTTTTVIPAHDVCHQYDIDGNCTRWVHVNEQTIVNPPLYKGTQVLHDWRDRITDVKGPNGEETLTTFGARPTGGSRVIRTVVGASVWDPTAKTSTATNLTTTLDYDLLGKLAQITDAQGQTTAYLYDLAGRIAQVTQHGGTGDQIRTWSYDALGRVVSMAQPESGTTTYSAFTVTGKPTLTTYNGGPTLSGSLDPLDRVTSSSSGDGSVSQSFTYADAGSGLATGKLISATSNGITRTFAYGGPAGELSSLTYQVDGQSYVLGLAYDPNYGFLTSRTYPNGKVQTLAYDLERGLPSGASLQGATLASFGYDGVSWLVTGLTYGNNGTTVYGYTNERLATLAHAIPGTTLASWAFGYDAAGQLTTDGEDAYGYDALGRLVQAEIRDPQDATGGHGLQQVFQYDAFGNRVSLSSQRATTWTDPTKLPASPSLTALASTDHRVQSYAMTSSEITAMDATNRLPSTVGGVATGATYDPQGNLTGIFGVTGDSTTQLTLTYDALGRVVTLGDTKHATSQGYGYDDQGLRIKVTDSATGKVTYHLYDEARHLIATYEGPSGSAPAWKKDILYVGDKEVAEVDGSHTWVEFLDHLGSPRYQWDGTAVTGIDGVHLIAQKYAPFGEYLNDPTTQLTFAKGFTNHEQTDASGLIYMQARFYAPMYGRFLSPDPARDQHFEQTQSWNIYSYVQNDPTMLFDPNGQQARPASPALRKLEAYAPNPSRIGPAGQAPLAVYQNVVKPMAVVAYASMGGEVFGPMLLRMAGIGGAAEAPQLIQKGQQLLQDAQQAAPEAPQLQQEAQAAGNFAQQLGSMSKDALGQVLPQLGQVKQIQQLVGNGSPGKIQEAMKAVSEGKLPEGLTLQAVQTYAEIARRALVSNPENVLQQQRLEICNKAMQLLQTR